MAKKITETEIAITERFFFALAELKRRKVIRGLKTFSRAHDINQGNFSSFSHKTDSWSMRADYLAFLAQDYGVSCEWLLLGNGDMFLPNSPALYFRPKDDFNSDSR